ncbi:hypothetical protein DPMN_014214 [Dreissena polymorpha]|uniref:Uncharacterized protein n=1 Tax=Dreissena polymorpha TaxID=45954 RepID=A0A9D4NBA1_DREPO|nr:hypothetical protein DPMN_014214 [Dreissena polymorpha]
MEDELLRGIQVSAEQCTVLQNATVNQASNTTWVDQRKGRITASSRDFNRRRILRFDASKLKTTRF